VVVYKTGHRKTAQIFFCPWLGCLKKNGLQKNGPNCFGEFLETAPPPPPPHAVVGKNTTRKKNNKSTQGGGGGGGGGGILNSAL